MKSRMSVVAFALTMLPALAAAQDRIDQRQQNQQKRIDQGVKSGELTKKEAERLQQGQQRVQQMEDKARADGKITKEERRRIEQAQDRERDNIRRESRDRNTVQNQHKGKGKGHDKDGHPGKGWAKGHDKKGHDQDASRIDRRQQSQQARIDSGVKSGELTKREAAQLQDGQRRIQRMEDQARADGKVTREERERIERAQDEQSRAIQRQSQDRQRAK